MERWKKGLVLLIAVIFAATAVVATQYAKMATDYKFKVDSRKGNIQLVAEDGRPVGSGFLLTNDTTGWYYLELGTWVKGTNKTYTAAFAIVNLEAVALYITRMEVSGTGSAAINVFLHDNMSTPSLTLATRTGIARESWGTDNLPDTCDSSSMAAVRYINNGTSVDHGKASPSLPFILAAAGGSDGYSVDYTVLTYHTGATLYTAAWNAANNVWKNSATAQAIPGCTTATTFSNFVWVEVTLNTAGIANNVPGAGTLTMYFET